MSRRTVRDRRQTMNRRALLYGAGATAVAGLAAWQLWPAGAGGRVATDAIGDKVQRLPASDLPEFARGGDTHRLYRYAVEHGEDLRYMPCFCGCYRFGHQNNRDCYIKTTHGDGTLTFTSHAAT